MLRLIAKSGVEGLILGYPLRRFRGGRVRRRWFSMGVIFFVTVLMASACGRSDSINHQAGGHYKIGAPYVIKGVRYYPRADRSYSRIGMASWYGGKFHGRVTANGELFDKYKLSAAHPTLPLPSHVRVKNLDNGRSLVLRVNDRGPFVAGRIIDVSERAAEFLKFRGKGVERVRVTYLGPAPLGGVIYDRVTRVATP